MTSPFDRLPRLPGMRGGDERSWLSAWIDLTTWWVEPALAAAQSLPAQADQLLSQLIEGIATRFAGGRIDAQVQGRRVQASLDGLRLVRRDNRRELRVDASDGEIDGVPFDDLRLVAHSTRVEPGLDPTIVIRDFTIEAHAPLVPLVAWIGRRIDEWTITVEGSTVVARHGSRSFVVEPAVRDDIVYLELRTVRWKGLRARVPHWLRLEHRIPLTLAPGWTLAEASRRDDVVHLRIRGPEIEHRLGAKGLRDIVMNGGRLTI